MLFKSYYIENLAPSYSLVVYIFIFTLLTFLLLLSLRWANLNKTSNNVTFVFLVMWFFRVLLAYISPFISFFPDFNDTYLFSDMIVNNYFPENQSIGVSLFYIATYPLRLISFFNVTNFVLIQSFIYFFAMLVMWRAYCLYVRKFYDFIPNANSFIIYIILFSVYPASIMFVSVPLREFFLVLNVSLFMYGIVQVKVRSDYLVLLISFILIFFVRPQLVLTFLVTFFLLHSRNKLFKIIMLFLMPLLVLNVFSILYYDISPELLSKIRHSWVAMHSDNVYGDFTWVNWLDVIYSYPLLLSQYLLSPLPILHSRSPFEMLASLLDVIFLSFIFVVFFISFRKKIFSLLLNDPFVVFVIVVTGLSALWEAYIGGAVRHRITTVVVLLPIAAYLLAKIFSSHFNHVKKE